MIIIFYRTFYNHISCNELNQIRYVCGTAQELDTEPSDTRTVEPPISYNTLNQQINTEV